VAHVGIADFPSVPHSAAVLGDVAESLNATGPPAAPQRTYLCYMEVPAFSTPAESQTSNPSWGCLVIGHDQPQRGPPGPGSREWAYATPRMVYRLTNCCTPEQRPR